MLTPAESRFGLGLPLKLRPKADLATYTKVSLSPLKTGNVLTCLAQLCRTALLPTRHRWIQSLPLFELSPPPVRHLEITLSDSDLDGHCDFDAGTYCGNVGADLGLSAGEDK